MTDATPYRKVRKYELRELIGEGAMGVVWKAYDSVLRRFVALKFLNASFGRTEAMRERFLREARAVAALQHPNIVTIHELGEVDRQLFIAMELVEGRDLSDLIASRAPLPLEHKLDIAVELLSGLGYAHAAGVIHRDIKPSNVRLTADGRVKIMDFGIARVQAEDSLGSDGAIVGTPTYMAPEQITNGEITPATDIYSAGCLLYELLTYEKPFLADTVHGIFYQVLSVEVKPLRAVAPSIPAALERLVHKAMAKAPRDRYQSAGEFRAAILGIRQAISGAGDSTTLPVGLLPTRFGRMALRLLAPASRRQRLGALGTLVVVAGIVAYLALTGTAPGPTTGAAASAIVAAAAAPADEPPAPIPGLGGTLAVQRDSAYAARGRAVDAGAFKNASGAAALGDALVTAGDSQVRAGLLTRAATSYVGAVEQFSTALNEMDSARVEAEDRIRSARALVAAIPADTARTRATGVLVRADSLFRTRDFVLASLAASEAEQVAERAGAVAPSVSPQPADARTAIAVLLRDFGRAVDERDTGRLRALYPDMRPADAASWQAFFEGNTGIDATFTARSLTVRGTSARGAVHAAFHFRAKGEDRPTAGAREFLMRFARTAAGWRVTWVDTLPSSRSRRSPAARPR